MTTHTVSRRDFVVVLTATGGGLLLGCRVGDRSGAATAAAAPPVPPLAEVCYSLSRFHHSLPGPKLLRQPVSSPTPSFASVKTAV